MPFPSHTSKYFRKYINLLCGAVMCTVTPAQAQSDEFIEGYAQALMKFQHGFAPEALFVKKGVIYVRKAHMPPADFNQVKGKLAYTLQEIPGVVKVVFLTDGEEHYHKTKGSSSIPPSKSEPQRQLIDGFLAPQTLFKPLIADPKWPRFSVAYHYLGNNNIAKHVFAPNFGATFSVYRAPLHKGQMEVGIQAGLFGIMDIGKSPTALINADYMVGLPLSYRSGAWSTVLRFYHISAHLGDEFLLTSEGKNTERVNLSYEILDALLSYEYASGFRLYGGGGYIVHRDPSSLKPGRLQAGFEYRHPDTFWGAQLRPLMGFDVKSNQHSQWRPDLSLKGGVRIENSSLTDKEIQLMLELYNGRSMHGQFYKQRLRYIGLGIHVFL